MHDGANDFGEFNDESFSSEVSSYLTTTTHSSASDFMMDSNSEASGHEFGHAHVNDPLRFPVHDGDEMDEDLKASKGEIEFVDSKYQHYSRDDNIQPQRSKVRTSSMTSSGSTPKHSSRSDCSINSSSNLSHQSNPSSCQSPKLRYSSHPGKSKDINMSELELSLPASQVYQPETVDFPSSPTTFLHSSNISSQDAGSVVCLAEGESEIQSELSLSQTIKAQSSTTSSSSGILPTDDKITTRKERPKNLEVASQQNRKRLTVTEELLNVNVDDDLHSISSLSYHETDDEDDDAQMLSHDEFTDMLTPDDIATPDELEESIMDRLGPVDPPSQSQPVESTSARNPKEEPSWRSIVISGIERRIDMKVIEPYKKVLSHGGYMLEGNTDAIIVFSACFLPDRSRPDYDYVMDHLFMYVLTTLETLIEEDYVLVYLHGATSRGNMPSFAWLKRCYQMIDRRLRKNLQGLYLVHPTFWVKTIVVMARPFVSSKFTRKLRFIANLKELSDVIPLDEVCIPARVKQYDEIRESLVHKK